MDLTAIFTHEQISIDIASVGKKESLIELSRLFSSSGVVGNLEKFMESVLAREELGSTGIGDGIAIPHGKSPTVNKLSFAFGRSNKGVEFESLDQKPVNLLFLVASPINQDTQYIKLLACLARLIKNADFRASLIAARDEAEIYDMITKAAALI
jgi:fructose-specific phosphotransferase system IIA component